MVQCGICKYKETYILGELWLKSPKCGNHCKTWIDRFTLLQESNTTEQSRSNQE